MTSKVSLQSDRQCLGSGLKAMDAVIKIQDAQQMLSSKLRHRISDADNALPFPCQTTNVCTLFSGKGQLGDSSVTEVCNDSECLVGSHNRLVSSQHLPIHTVMISKFEDDDTPFTLREESVFRQIVHNGNVEFCQDVAIVIEPVSSEAFSWFLPGDQLIAVNDVTVESKDEAWQRVSECKLETLKLSVRPLAELSELSVRYMHYHGDDGPRSINCPNTNQQHDKLVSVY